MKKLSFVFVIALLLGSTFPQARAEVMDLDICVEATVVSKYIWRGFDVLDGKPAFQPSIDLSLNDTGFGLKIWGSFALDDRSTLGDYDEVHLVLSFERGLTDFFSILVGTEVYKFPNLDKNNITYEVFLGGTLTKILFAPTLALYYDFDLGNGLYAEVSGSYDIPLGNYVLSTSLTIGYNDGQFNVDPGFSDITFSASMDLPIWKLTITPGVYYTFILEDTVNEDDGEFWALLKASLEF